MAVRLFQSHVLKAMAFALLFVSLLQEGCVTAPIAPSRVPPQQQASISNQVYEAMITPAYLYFGQVPAGFALSIRNKSSGDIQVDWNRTAFIDNGATHGGFMYEGIPFPERNSPKEPDTIFPGGVLKKDIFPIITADFRNGRWGYAGIEGKVGVLLVIKVGNAETQQAIILPQPVL